MIYLYQIGRLDKDVIKSQKLNFLIDKNFFESELSSFALKNYFKDNVKCILIYPVSLPFNKRLISDSNETNEFREILKTAI